MEIRLIEENRILKQALANAADKLGSTYAFGMNRPGWWSGHPENVLADLLGDHSITDLYGSVRDLMENR